MKIKTFLTAMMAAVALNASAGEWCAPDCKDKCVIEEPCLTGFNMTFGYETDYVFYGVRVASDYIWADLSYTFDCLPLPITVGVWTMNSMENQDGYGNEVDPYISVGLPSVLGFDIAFTYTLFTFPEFRNAAPGNLGDSTNELSMSFSREIWGGLGFGYTVRHDLNVPGAFAGPNTVWSEQNGAWVHDLSLTKGWDVTDCIGLELTGGVLYTDNYWSTIVTSGGDSGWNNYYFSLAMPITVGCNASITPHISYSGTPDGWVADGAAGGVAGANQNDVFYGGVSIGVDF